MATPEEVSAERKRRNVSHAKAVQKKKENHKKAVQA